MSVELTAAASVCLRPSRACRTARSSTRTCAGQPVSQSDSRPVSQSDSRPVGQLASRTRSEQRGPSPPCRRRQQRARQPQDLSLTLLLHPKPPTRNTVPRGGLEGALPGIYQALPGTSGYILGTSGYTSGYIRVPSSFRGSPRPGIYEALP
eukprot:8507247-Pyramimonas_sp.AAC.1